MDLGPLAGVFVLSMAASSAMSADRYWVAPIIGTWADASNWSQSSGGPGGQGLPMGGERIFMDQRSIAIFNGAGVGNPNFDALEMSGSGSGVTQLNMGSGSMGITEVVVGQDADACELLVTNAQLVSDSIKVGIGTNSTDALLKLSGSGLIDTLSIQIGVGSGVGSVELDAGTLRAEDLTIGIAQPHPGLGGSFAITGGTLDAESIIVGESGDASLVQTGGHIEVTNYYIGTTGRSVLGGDAGFSETADHTGGTLDVYLMIVGRDQNLFESYAKGEMRIDGTDISAFSILVGGFESWGYLTLESGTLDVEGIANIASSGNSGQTYVGEVTQSGGSFTSAVLILGSDGTGTGPINAIPMRATYEMSGGTADHNSVRIGQSENSDAMLYIRGDAVFNAGSITSTTRHEDSKATLLVAENGTVNTPSLSIGSVLSDFSGGDTEVNVTGGTLAAGAIIVQDFFESVKIEQSGGLLSASRVEARGDADYWGGVTLIGGVLEGYYETIGPVAPVSTRIRDNADFRTREFRHNGGPLEFGPGTPSLSGPFFINNLTAGTLDLHAPMTVTADAGAIMMMNVTNSSIITIETGSHLPIEGTFTNNRDIVLNEGTLSVTTPVDHAFGTISGVGTIDADLHHDAQLEPTIMTVTGSLACGPDSVTKFQLGTVGSTTLDAQGPSVTLDGELHLEFVTGAAQPMPGTTYDIISTPNTTATGTFSNIVFEGAAVPAEVVYEADRVCVRVLYCSRADLAEPYGVIDFFDISAFISLYQAQDPIADLAAPFGTINFFDVSAFLSLFQDGCP
ncbi:MAG: hypothetical protein CMJ35_04650 [Phycisphaerae bacterium]|nr:hypothetical protein [Phycisphaerae bacterium]